MADQHWPQVKESGALLGMRFMLAVYHTLGRLVFKIVLYPVIAYFYLTNGAARRASLSFLSTVRQAGGEVGKGSLRVQSFRHFLQFGETLLDKIAAWAGEYTYKNVRFHQRDIFLNTVDKGKGALVIVSHLGNLEVCRALADEAQRIKLNILVHTKHAPKFNRLLKEVDKDNYLTLLQVTDIDPATAVMLKERLDKGEVVVVAGDRTPVDGGRCSTVDFMGEPAKMPQGPMILAGIMKCPVFLMFCVKETKGYEIFFEAFADLITLPRKERNSHIQKWVQRFAARLECYALRYPLQWANFYDFWR